MESYDSIVFNAEIQKNGCAMLKINRLEISIWKGDRYVMVQINAWGAC
jgi:hypothetical protein